MTRSGLCSRKGKKGKKKKNKTKNIIVEELGRADNDEDIIEGKALLLNHCLSMAGVVFKGDYARARAKSVKHLPAVNLSIFVCCKYRRMSFKEEQRRKKLSSTFIFLESKKINFLLKHIKIHVVHVKKCSNKNRHFKMHINSS